MSALGYLDEADRRRVADARSRSLEAFLRGRGLTRPDLANEARARGGSGEVHFVSTIVSDLAGSTSDIDMIIVSEAADADEPLMSTMAFFESARLGVKRYVRADVEADLARLDALVDLSASELATGLERWKGAIPLIDLERLINGLTEDGACPFAGHLPNLCATRFAASFDLFRESLLLAVVSRRAGEARAPWGYVLGGLPHLMDAILACEGSVVTNTKWSAQRWRQSASRHDARWVVVDDWWRRAWRSLGAGEGAPSSEALMRLYEEAVAGFGFSPAEDADIVRWRDDVTTAPFGAQVWLSRDGAGRIALHPSPGRREPLSVNDLIALDGREASSLLTAARAGFISLRLREARLRAPLSFLQREIA